MSPKCFMMVHHLEVPVVRIRSLLFVQSDEETPFTMFIKKFKTFAEGINSLLAVSISARDLLGQTELDLSSEVAVRARLVSYSMARPTKSRVQWNTQMYSSPVGAAYKTDEGLLFGWGCLYDDALGEYVDNPVFFIADREKPGDFEGGDLILNLDMAGWKRLHYRCEGPDQSLWMELRWMAAKVGWIPTANDI